MNSASDASAWLRSGAVVVRFGRQFSSTDRKAARRFSGDLTPLRGDFHSRVQKVPGVSRFSEPASAVWCLFGIDAPAC